MGINKELSGALSLFDLQTNNVRGKASSLVPNGAAASGAASAPGVCAPISSVACSRLVSAVATLAVHSLGATGSSVLHVLQQEHGTCHNQRDHSQDVGHGLRREQRHGLRRSRSHQASVACEGGTDMADATPHSNMTYKGKFDKAVKTRPRRA